MGIIASNDEFPFNGFWDRNKDRDQDWDLEQWNFISCYVLSTLDRDREPLFSIVPVPVPAPVSVSVPVPRSVYDPLDPLREPVEQYQFNGDGLCLA